LRIRIPDPDPGFDDLKWKKITAEKNIYFFFGSKTTIYLSQGLHKGRPSYRRSLLTLKREYPALQNMKILSFFLFLWVIFALLDPDPATQINADPSGSGSETLQETK
jgi:hypothetical protein